MNNEQTKTWRYSCHIALFSPVMLIWLYTARQRSGAKEPSKPRF